IHYSISILGFSIAVALFFGFLLRNSIVNSLVIFLLFLGGFIVSNNGFNLIGNPFSYQNIDHAILMTSTYYPVGLNVLIGAIILIFLLSLSMNRKRGI